MKYYLLILSLGSFNLLFGQRDFTPTIAPDGTTIAFYRYVGEEPHLFTINIDGTELKQLTEGNLWHIGPTWSVDGKTLYFSIGENMMTMDVANLNLSTNKIKRIPREGMQFSIKTEGEDLLWASRGKNGFTFYKSNLKNLSEGLEIEVKDFSNYWLYTKGSKIFIIAKDEGKKGLYILENNTMSKIIEFKKIQNFSVSNDGKFVLFESDDNGIMDVYLAKSDGTELRNLTNSESIDYMPSFSPNADFIVFTSNRDEGFFLYKLNLNSQEVTRLTR